MFFFAPLREHLKKLPLKYFSQIINNQALRKLFSSSYSGYNQHSSHPELISYRHNCRYI